MRVGTYNDLLCSPPSLIRGAQYPISDKEERILDAAYRHGYTDAMRMNRAGRLVEDDPFLDFMRKRVEEIRKEKIKKGLIEPSTKEEEALK